MLRAAPLQRRLPRRRDARSRRAPSRSSPPRFPSSCPRARARRWCVVSTPSSSTAPRTNGGARARGAHLRALRVSRARPRRRRRRRDVRRPGRPTTTRVTCSASSASATSRAGCWRTSRGLELVELPQADQCCGFGGAFAVKFPEISAAIMAAKIAAIESTGADAVVANDWGCLMHVGGGLRGRGVERARAAPRRDPRPATAGRRAVVRRCSARTVPRLDDPSLALARRPSGGSPQDRDDSRLCRSRRVWYR